MKKISYILGMICLSISFLAIALKISHLPGANILLIAGIGSLTLFFIPTAYFAALMSTDSKALKFLYAAAFISFFIDFIGILFKVMHWPGAGYLMIIGIPLPFILFLPAYIVYHIRKKLKTDLNFLAILAFMIYIGVFSTFLAISPSSEIYASFAHSANELTETNNYLQEVIPVKDGNKISNSVNQLVKNLDETKQTLILNIKNSNQIFVNSKIDYNQLSDKELKLSEDLIEKAGLGIFDQQFEKLCKMLEVQSNDETINRLISEINTYRLPIKEGEDPVIFQLPLIAVLEVLTEWQNKLLLISYFDSIRDK